MAGNFEFSHSVFFFYEIIVNWLNESGEEGGTSWNGVEIPISYHLFRQSCTIQACIEEEQ